MCDLVAMREYDVLRGQDPATTAALIAETGTLLGMHHAELAKHLGVSRRTVSRWASEGTRLTSSHVEILATLAYPRDRSLAARIAALAKDTLVGLGLEEPPPPAPPPPPPSPKLVDAVVCAAADVLELSPRAVRPALLAALRCAREAGLSLETIEGVLSQAVEAQGGSGTAT